VVLSNGTIINANPSQNADLHKALKGGGNNFGIVTRFDIRAFRQGRIWSAWTYAAPGRKNIPNRWFEYFASSRNRDLGGMIMYYANYIQGSWVNQAFISYVHPQENPQVFSGLLNSSTTGNAGITMMQEVTRKNAITTPAGTRASFSTFTIVNSARYMEALLELGEQYAKSLRTLSTMNLIFEPLWTAPRLQSFQYGGGNVLGLEDEQRDLVIVLIHSVWSDAMESRQVKSNMREFINRAERLAQQMGVHHPYKYLNYAESFQDVISSYGSASVDFMIHTSEKYDPIQLWQRRVPGGFKLPRRNQGNSYIPTPAVEEPRSTASKSPAPANTARQTQARAKPTMAPQRQDIPPDMPHSQPQPGLPQSKPQDEPQDGPQDELEPQTQPKYPRQPLGAYRPSGEYRQPNQPYVQPYPFTGYPPQQAYPYYYPNTQYYYPAPGSYFGPASRSGFQYSPY
jgi:hypothetical protein